MKKNISFFDTLFNVVIVGALYILMIGISFILVTLTNYSHENEIIQYDSSILKLEEDISVLKGYFVKNNLYLYLEFENEQTNTELLACGYTYKDYYNKNVYIDCLNRNSYVYVVVNLNNEASIV